MKDFGEKYNCKVELTTFENMDEAMAKLRTGQPEQQKSPVRAARPGPRADTGAGDRRCVQGRPGRRSGRR
jgi:hypothetical protein